jgi:SAM-dependent methyltransferase
MSRYRRLRERYETGEVPWDDDLPPPEVQQEAASLTPGRALDLGCGYGRASIYLAGQGWQVDGVDFVDLAIIGARQRAEIAGVAARTSFHLSPVTDMPFLHGPFDLALDVGCMHSFDAAQQRTYRDELRRLLRPGARYLLFAHLRDEDEPAEESRWADEATLRALFAAGFALDRVEHGVTQVEDQDPWRSAWFWFRRVAADTDS